MRAPGFGVRFFVVVVGIFASTVVAAPVVKLGVDWLVVSQPGISELLHIEPVHGEYDFGRVYRRLFLLVALIGLLSCRRWLGPVRLNGMGAGDARWKMLGAGLLAGIASWTLLLGVLVLLGRRTFAPELPPDWAGELLLALVAALLVGVIEEVAFRGYVLGGLLRDWPGIAAVIVSSGLYSVMHFLKARTSVTAGWDPSVGVEALVAHFRPLGRPEVFLPFVGLLLVGVVLSYAYLWGRSLPFAIGLHTGWVFLIMIDGFFLLEPTKQSALYGEGGILGGVLSWAFLLLLLLGLRFGLRNVGGQT